MITCEFEDYVSFETAKLLKEKGFDYVSFCCYEEKGINDILWVTLSAPLSNSDLDNTIEQHKCYSAPTLQMAMKWLEEKYGIFCVIRRHGNKDDGFTYSWNCEGRVGLSVGNGGGFKTATGVREAAIKYCLKELI